MKRFHNILLAVAAALLLTGCSFRSVDQMYRLPKRSEDYNDLQTAIDAAMSGLEYCAPLKGEQRQTVQMADLDGDGQNEYLLFAKGGSDTPLRILVFDYLDGKYVHVDTIESTGTAFDQVEYVQMDAEGGVEVIVGRQVSDQVLGSVSVYTFSGGEAEQLVTTSYTKFLAVNLDRDVHSELLVIRPGPTETDRGVVELYSITAGNMERSVEVNMSSPADKLKRILTGKLHGGQTAVYVASAVDDQALITDVYAVVDGTFTNVTFSNESGTSVQTMRNYFVYADDIDADGVIELPYLLDMQPLSENRGADNHHIVRWYAMTPDGGEVDKLYTYHDFVGGWYMEMDSHLASRVTVSRSGNEYTFHLWDDSRQFSEKLMTVSVLSGQNREEQASMNNRFVLLKTDTVIYTAAVEPAAEKCSITREGLIQGFHLIHQDWKTGETS